MSLITVTQIASMLRPGLAGIVQPAAAYDPQWTEIFTRRSSDKEREIILEVKPLGLAQLKSEGASVAFDSMHQTYTTTFVNRYVALGFIITRQAIMDNLYKEKFKANAEGLRDSLRITKEILASSVLNNGFDSNFPLGDGKALFATDHPISGGPGIVANTFSVQADLSQASLQDAYNAVEAFRDPAGLLRQYRVKKMVVHRNNRWVAERLLGSEYVPDSGNNAINPLKSTKAVPEGYKVNQYLTNTKAWFLLTDAPEGFIYFDRESVTTDSYVDFATQNAMFQGFERYSFGVANFRAGFGSSGS